MECVIVGGGIAGLQAALTIRKYWPDKAVTLVDAEQEVGYYRTLLPQYMMRTLAEKKLYFWSFKDDPLITIRTGIKAESIDRKNQYLYLANRQKLEYERLVIASGGRPIIPPIFPREYCKGVFPVRSLPAARAIREWLPDHPEVVILGGGLVGVKTASHFAQSNLSVTLIEKEQWLLPQALSFEASSRVLYHFEKNRVRIFLGCSIEDIHLEDDTIKAVAVDGKWIPCQTLLLAAGSIPDVDFLQESDLLDEGALVVTTSLQTCDSMIFAAGDVVTITDGRKNTPWTWPQAVTQGKLAGANIYDPVPMSLNCLTRVNSMNLNGLSLVILGAPIPGADVVCFSKPADNVYRELFLIDGQIMGGVLVKDISDAGRLHAIMVSGERIGSTGDEIIKPCGRTFLGGVRDGAQQHRRAYVINI